MAGIRIVPVFQTRQEGPRAGQSAAIENAAATVYRSTSAYVTASTVSVAEGEEMNKQTAEALIKDILACSGRLDQSVGAIQGTVAESDFKQYRAVVGETMGLLYIEILRDLFRQFPELEPDSMK